MERIDTRDNRIGGQNLIFPRLFLFSLTKESVGHSDFMVYTDTVVIVGGVDTPFGYIAPFILIYVEISGLTLRNLLRHPHLMW